MQQCRQCSAAIAPGQGYLLPRVEREAQDSVPRSPQVCSPECWNTWVSTHPVKRKTIKEFERK